MAKTIQIIKIIETPYAVAKEDGDKLYLEIKSALESENKIVLDFDGITRATSLFFNVSLCTLAIELQYEKYEKIFSIINASDVIKPIYVKAMELALKKFKNEEIFIEALQEELTNEKGNKE